MPKPRGQLGEKKLNWFPAKGAEKEGASISTGFGTDCTIKGLILIKRHYSY